MTEFLTEKRVVMASLCSITNISCCCVMRISEKNSYKNMEAAVILRLPYRYLSEAVKLIKNGNGILNAFSVAHRNRVGIVDRLDSKNDKHLSRSAPMTFFSVSTESKAISRLNFAEILKTSTTTLKSAYAASEQLQVYSKLFLDDFCVVKFF